MTCNFYDNKHRVFIDQGKNYFHLIKNLFVSIDEYGEPSQNYHGFSILEISDIIVSIVVTRNNKQ